MLQNCESCQIALPIPPKEIGNPWKWPSGPWKQVHVDFAGPFLGQMFLIMIDAYSKWSEVYPMKSVMADQITDVMR